MPPAISDVITQHATQLQQTANAPLPDTGPPQPVASAPKPGTRAYTQAQSAPAAEPAPAAPAPTPSAPVSPVPVRSKIVPARPRQTAEHQQALARVRKENPGPVFATGGRVRAVLSAITCGLIIFGANRMFQTYAGSGLSHDHVAIFRLGIFLLVISMIWSIGKALLPGLHLKINSDGLLISRTGLTREIPWSRVQRVGVVGSGKRTSVAVWLTDGSTPSSRLWHRARRYHGGARIFPLGATGGWLTRRQETRRVRTALAQYAIGRYDARIL